MIPEDQPDHAPEFWEEQEADVRRHIRRAVLRAVLVFSAVALALAVLLGWTHSAVQFTAARVQQKAEPTYRVSGQVRDAVSGAPVPWPHVYDDPSGSPPRFEVTGSHEGVFELSTLPEPHSVQITALGYQSAAFPVGRRWYRWLPKGKEQLDVRLYPETKRGN